MSIVTIRPYTAEELIDYASGRRWQVETGGITINGATIDTSRESQAMISGAYNYSQANPGEIIKFKASSGWIDLDAATVAMIAMVVGEHVQSCFAKESAIVAAINNGTITTVAEVDNAWND